MMRLLRKLFCLVWGHDWIECWNGRTHYTLCDRCDRVARGVRA